MFTSFKKGLIHGLWIVVVIGVTSIWYAAFTNILTVSDGEQLTSWKWNELVNRLNSIDEQQLATAWVNFDGRFCTGWAWNECVIRDSYNVSRVTRVTTGHFYIHFQTAMDNPNYVMTWVTWGTGGSDWDETFPVKRDTVNTNTSQVNIMVRDRNTSDNVINPSFGDIVIFGWKN